MERRRFLRGAVGATLALPLLEWLDTRVARGGPFPVRLVILFTPNGVPQTTWAPTVSSETLFTLSPVLGCLEPHKSDLLILRGVDMESSYHGPGDGMHLNGIGHLLTGTELVSAGNGDYWAGGISIDQHIAATVGKQTKLKSLELAVGPAPATIKTRLAYLGAAQPLPPIYDPLETYDRLFGETDPTRLAQRKRVLDAVLDDMADVKKKMSGDDRKKLEAHTDALAEIESKLGVGAGACGPKAPPELADMTYEALGRAQIDLLVQGLACDLTRVATLLWSGSTSTVVFDWLGITEQHHALSHVPATDATAQFRLTDINRWYASQLGYLLDKLKSVPEGGGTLLDNTIVLWGNELSDGVVHSRRDMPFVLAGKGGGALKTGRVVTYQGAKHNDLLVALANAMGVPTTSFGNPAYCSGPLANLG